MSNKTVLKKIVIKEKILTDPHIYQIKCKFYKPPVPPKPKRRFAFSRNLSYINIASLNFFSSLDNNQVSTPEPLIFGEQERPNEDELISSP